MNLDDLVYLGQVKPKKKTKNIESDDGENIIY